MDQQHENFQKLFGAIYLILSETHKPQYLPNWMYNFWHSEITAIVQLKEAIHAIEEELPHCSDTVALEKKLITLLDQERYLAAIHVWDMKLLNRIQDVMVAVLFFSQEDIQKYDEFVLIEQDSKKFIEYLKKPTELTIYSQYLKKQQSVYGRFIKNFSEAEINSAAKAQMINGKLLDYFELPKFLKHGFQFIKQELKALSIHDIEEGYLNKERIDSYIDKISLLLHPANEVRQDDRELVKRARYILEDIINTAGVKEHAVPNYPEHSLLINGCYWVDEMFKTAAAQVEASFIT